MSVVEIENVTKTFGEVRAVDSLFLSVPRGSIPSCLMIRSGKFIATS
jgi:ABC-type multidrug transport system ATPase subunit